MSDFENFTLEHDGEEFKIDQDLHNTLNMLARRFYKSMGYVAEKDFNFHESLHPQEQHVYQLAFIAYVFNLNVGLD